MDINPKRIRKLNFHKYHQGAVVYWMSREQRVNDNWALLTAQASALKYKQPLLVVFCLQDSFLDSGLRQYTFMLQGLEQVEAELRRYKIPFFLLKGSPAKVLPEFLKKYKAGALISDFSPLNISRQWRQEVRQIKIPFWEVDGHNVVPVWEASGKQESSLKSFKSKLRKHLGKFLTEFPPLVVHPFSSSLGSQNSFSPSGLRFQNNVPEVKIINSGEKFARNALNNFVLNHLKYYSEQKNDPNKQMLAEIYVYLHFGQICSQRIILEIINSDLSQDRNVLIDELVFVKELADNFCHYNINYDNFFGFPIWAQGSLNQHRKDKREQLYSFEQLENAETHDEFWNAIQVQIFTTGTVSNFLRKYWAKKFLEWTADPETALRIANQLNCQYTLDGRDPVSHAIIAKAIGGVHDKQWFERKVFGKIRSFDRGSIEQDFDLESYIGKYIR